MASEFALPRTEFPSKYKIAQIPSICCIGFYLPAFNLLYTSRKLFSHLLRSPNSVFSLNSWKPIHFFPARSSVNIIVLYLSVSCYRVYTFYLLFYDSVAYSHPAETGNNDSFLYTGISKIRFPWNR